ncbi:MAG TPA: lactoylglutathione lyase [Ignavibacteria bacterium]|nr:lactoylglutathione lyase [Ignavibacteria bacterium]
MIKKSHIIFYVEDQQKSTEFYSQLLNLKPTLNVPGMTEFHLSSTTVLGLMPARGIKKLLGDKIEQPEKKLGQPRGELYLLVNDIENYINRAATLGAKKLDDLKERNWGHRVIYFEDPDGYVIAIAEEIKRVD